MAGPELIAVDWGTTNRRIYALDAARRVLATERSGCGVLTMARDAFGPEVAAIRLRFGDAPILCAGMVGSTRGWAEAPYVACPAGPYELATRLHWVEPGRTAIVPGIAVREPSFDVMRGEEVQLVGAVAAGLAPAHGLFIQPGTHCKWARLLEGRVASFRTTMTGEMFALLRQYSLLGDLLAGDVTDGDAFAEGLGLARRGTLLSSLFGERARVMLGGGDIADVAARVSGLMIGTDVNEAGLQAGERAFVLADAKLGPLYARAVGAAGGEAVLLDSEAAFVAGIGAIWDIVA